MSKYWYAIVLAISVSSPAWSMWNGVIKYFKRGPLVSANNTILKNVFEEFAKPQNRYHGLRSTEFANLQKVLIETSCLSLTTGITCTVCALVTPFPLSCVCVAGMINFFANACIHYQNISILKAAALCDSERVHRFFTSLGANSEDCSEKEVKKELTMLSQRTCIDPSNYMALWYLATKKN
jgi:hypothetical protein